MHLGAGGRLTRFSKRAPPALSSPAPIFDHVVRGNMKLPLILSGGRAEPGCWRFSVFERG